MKSSRKSRTARTDRSAHSGRPGAPSGQRAFRGLRDLGAEVLEIPFIEIRKPRSYKALDGALKNLSEYDWLILTSVNGVEALWERLRKLRLSGKPMVI